MPYSLNEGMIVQDPEGVSWAEAVKQQRSLRASAARYVELDEVTEEYVEAEIVPEVKAQNSELVRIEIGKEHDALIASMSERMDEMSRSQSETTMAIVAALQQIGLREPVFNVEAPNVSIEPAQITVEQPDITVNTPEVTVQAGPAPNVTVEPQIHLPSTQKTVTFERDPLTQQVTKAEVSEA
jgi:hypothetical protein